MANRVKRFSFHLRSQDRRTGLVEAALGDNEDLTPLVSSEAYRSAGGAATCAGRSVRKGQAGKPAPLTKLG